MKKKRSKEEARERFLEEVRKARQGRGAGGGRPEDTYRAKALEILPWVCAKCGRDFTGKNLRDLTVHHKDHDHLNNPSDGSNWELLCSWCHEDEHGRNEVADAYGGGKKKRERDTSTYKAFADLDKLLGGD